MLKNYRLLLLIGFIFCLNALIYIRAFSTIEDIDLVFGECARNSGRTSAALNLATLLMIGYFGLKTIFNNENKRKIFRILITLFAVNHLIHFYFVSQYFKDQFLELDISHNLHGFITFIFILTLPIILWSTKNLNKLLYFFILLHLFNVTYFISITFYSRVKPEDPAYLHQLGILFMIGTLVYILYRVVRENSTNLKNR
jgi:DMSO/TMAO reductase YedYZ heme-binding membrane subunit